MILKDKLDVLSKQYRFSFYYSEEYTFNPPKIGRIDWNFPDRMISLVAAIQSEDYRNNNDDEEDYVPFIFKEPYLILNKKTGGFCYGNCWGDKPVYEPSEEEIPPLYLLFEDLLGKKIGDIVSKSKVYTYEEDGYYGNRSDYYSLVIPIIEIKKAYSDQLF